MKTIQQTTPALRFKDEQGNDYPDWEQSKLGNIGTTFNGLTGKNSTHFGKGKPYIQYLQVFENSRIDVDEFGFVEIGENESQNKVCSGDVFFTTSSETPNEVGTASVLIDEVKNTYLNSFCFGYRVNKEYLLPEYARFAFRAISFRKNVVPLAQGSTRYNLSKTSLMKIITNLPSIEEQQKVASFLSSVDTKIEQLGKKKALLVQYKKVMMQKLFSQDIRFKDEQGNDYPNWEESCIHDICEINPTSGSLPNTFYYIDLESVHKGILVKQSKVMKINAPSRAQRLLRKQDVLFQTVRPYQKNNYYFELNGDYVASTGYAQLRAQSSSLFLFYLLHVQNIVNTIIARCTGTSYPAINSNDLGTIKVLIPAKIEQQKIADFLSAIDKKIELVAKQLEQARTFKKGLLQQMFI